jgi:hypothetical protein
VKLCGDPPTLALLGGQGAVAAGAPLALEPLEHPVEALGQRRHFRFGGLHGEAAAGLERIDLLHHGHQPAERGDGTAHQQQVDREHEQ